MRPKQKQTGPPKDPAANSYLSQDFESSPTTEAPDGCLLHDFSDICKCHTVAPCRAPSLLPGLEGDVLSGAKRRGGAQRLDHVIKRVIAAISSSPLEP